MYLMSLEQIKNYERYLIEIAGFNSLVLMENAATAIFNYIKNNFFSNIFSYENNLMENSNKKIYNTNKIFTFDRYKNNMSITILAGNSNNGGDAIAVARKLFLFFRKNNLKNFIINILILDKKFSYENQYQQSIISTFTTKNKQIKLIKFLPENAMSKQYESYFNCDILIDGLFGIGLKGKLRQNFSSFFEKVNYLKQKYNFKTIAIDLPSGLAEDYFNTTIFADIVLTLSFPKLSLFLPENRKNFSKLEILDIEFPAPEDTKFYSFIEKNELNSLKKNSAQSKKSKYYFNITLIEKDYIKKTIIPRSNFSNKGNFGKVCIFGGNFNTIGASILAAKSAFYSGTGLVYLFYEKSEIEKIKSTILEIITLSYDKQYYELGENKDSNNNNYNNNDNDDYEYKKFKITFNKNTLDTLNKIDTFIIGPGFGNNESLLYEYLKIILNISSNKRNISVVVDADALNLYSKSLKIKDIINSSTDKINFIFTPHLLEFSRILDLPIDEIKKDRINTGLNFSKNNNIFLYLKDSITFSFSPDGDIACNRGLNSGFSKGGTGDFVSGLIASFIAQKYNPFEAINIVSYILDCLTIYLDKNNISKYSYSPQLLIESLKYILHFDL